MEALQPNRQNGQKEQGSSKTLSSADGATSRGQTENACSHMSQTGLRETLGARDPSSLSREASPHLAGDDDEAVEPKSFERVKSGASTFKGKGEYGKVGEGGIRKMHKFTLYETSTRFYLIGADLLDERFRVLKIDRTAPPGQLSLFEDDIVYDKREMNQLLNAIDDGNRATGGLKHKTSTWGILGFIRFTEAYYMVLITKRRHVALLGGHYIYQVDGTELIPLTTGSTTKFQRDRNPEEARYLTIFGTLDLTRSLYFSYSYNITRTLQHNILRLKESLGQEPQRQENDLNDMFVWNHHLLAPALNVLRNPFDWCHASVYGFIDQKCMYGLL